MLEIIKNQIDSQKTNEENINQLREFLQILILKIIYDSGAFKYLSFTGGTALRILYNLQRYSEDLDFSLIQKKGFSFKHVHDDLKTQLTKNYGLKVITKATSTKTVQAIDLKFNEILFSLKLVPNKNQNLYIKVEIDSNPPKGGKTKLSLVSKSFVFTVTHFDLPSLYATKLHACLYRKFTKGRDIYDLIWYLGQKLNPNFTLLNHAIEQTTHENPQINEKNWKEFLLNKIEKVDFEAAKKDVEKFIIDKAELKLFNKKILKSIIAS